MFLYLCVFVFIYWVARDLPKCIMTTVPYNNKSVNKNEWLLIVIKTDKKTSLRKPDLKSLKS